jgi:hypothetical protein
MTAQTDYGLRNSLLEAMTDIPEVLKGMCFNLHNNWVKQNAGISEQPAF